MSLNNPRMLALMLAGCAAILAVVSVHLHLTLSHKPEPTPEVPADFKARRPSQSAPLLKVLEPSVRVAPTFKAPPTIITQFVSAEGVTNTLIAMDPEEGKIFMHRSAIGSFFRSPARDTPECRRILAILTANGYNIDRLQVCYNAAYELSVVDPSLPHPTAKVNGEPFDPNNASHVEALKRIRESERVRITIGMVRSGMPDQVISQILDVPIKVFWGNGLDPAINDSGLPPRENTDEELDKYLSEHTMTIPEPP
jgi:hypothetical protein